MGIKVVTNERSSADAGLLEETHPSGQATFVINGHLFVQERHNDQVEYTVAVYAPGSWLSATRV